MSQPTFYHGVCLTVLRVMPTASVDAVVTDPPYGLEFMGRAWDKFTPQAFQAFCQAWGAECLRVVKPGGHLLSFGGTRTAHRLIVGLEDAGFEIRDTLMWVHAQGFPKSLDISKALDKRAGAERPILGPLDNPGSTRPQRSMGDGWQTNPVVTAPATPAAQEWQGWGTALKPAQEPIVLARAPLSESSVAANIARWGTGGINVAGSRVEGRERTEYGLATATRRQGHVYGTPSPSADFDSTVGRWPPNLLFSHAPACNGTCVEGCPVAELDAQSGERTSGQVLPGYRRHGSSPFVDGNESQMVGYGDTGGASRFYPILPWVPDDVLWAPFYFTPKPSRAERDRGCEALPAHSAAELVQRTAGSAGLESPRAGAGRTSGGHNSHPTVKPVALMRWLCTLITPPGGIVLDPFGGSGTTIVAADQAGFQAIYIDQDAEYGAIARARFVGDAPLFNGGAA